MISASGEDIAFAMCGGCPVPEEVQRSYCCKWKGSVGLEYGNLCLLREMQRRGLRAQLTVPRSQPTGETRLRHHRKQATMWIMQRIAAAPVFIQTTLGRIFHCSIAKYHVQADDNSSLVTLQLEIWVGKRDVKALADFLGLKGTKGL